MKRLKQIISSLLLATCLFSSLLQINAEVPVEVIAAETGLQKGKRVKLMSYNIRNGRGLDGLTDYHRISSVVKNVAPDVVAVQEVDSVTGRSQQTDVLRVLAEQTGMYPTYAAAIDYDGGKYGIGILSREKPQAFYSIPLPGREEERTMLVAEFKEYIFCCMHLSLTAEDRMASLELIKKEARRAKKPFFIAGDWNAEPNSAFVEGIRKEFTLLTSPTAFTFPADKPNCCIDFIAGYAVQDKPFEVVSTYVYDEPVASDHRPVVVEMNLK